MLLHNLFGLLIYILTALVSLFMLAYFIFKAKKNALMYSFVFFQFMAFLWVIRALCWFTVMNFTIGYNIMKAYDVLNFKMGFFIGGFIGLSWLIFCLNYVEWKYAKSRIVILVLAFPTALFYVLCLKNSSQNTFFNGWNELGAYFWLHSFFAYFYSFLGMIVLFISARKRKGHERKETILLIIALMIPLLFSLISDLGIMFLNKARLLGEFDIVPEGFTIALVIIAFITFKYKFLSIRTLALNKIVYNLNQGIIIVDNDNKVISFNKVFGDMFSYNIKNKFKGNINYFVDILKELIENDTMNKGIIDKLIFSGFESYRAEISIFNSNKRFYEVSIQPVMDNEKLVGRIISFNDITRYKGIMDELNNKNLDLSKLNLELVNKNEQLLKYASTAEELAVTKERNRFSRDVHDTLGHTMTLLITQLKVINILCDTEPIKVKEKINEVINVAKVGLNELRRSIAGLTPGKLSENNLEEAILKLIADFEASGVKIDFVVTGISKNITLEYFQTLYRLCQEALTNSIRHGKAKHVDIVLNFMENKIKVFIKDDGCGCIEVKKGLGLSGMEQRVKNLNGNIEYGSDGENGFNIYVELPLIHQTGL
jgi:signal transduction histidine kinase